MEWNKVTDFERDLDTMPMTASPMSNVGNNQSKALKEGGIFHFTVTEFESPQAKGRILETVEAATKSAVARNTGGGDAIQAHWLPQGKALEISARPDLTGEPEVLFTPDFSGCSLVVQKLENGNLTVAHVQGGHHHVEVPSLGFEPRRVIGTLTHDGDYGSHNQPQAFSFMKFDRDREEWRIHSQERSGTIHVTGDKITAMPHMNVVRYSSKSAVELNTGLADVKKMVGQDARRQNQPLPLLKWARSEAAKLPDMESAPKSPSADSRSPFSRGLAPNPRDTAFSKKSGTSRGWPSL